MELIPDFFGYILHQRKVENADVEGIIEGKCVMPVLTDTSCVKKQCFVTEGLAAIGMGDNVHEEHRERMLVFLGPGEFVDVEQKGVFCKVKLSPFERLILNGFAGGFAGGHGFEGNKIINSCQSEGVVGASFGLIESLFASIWAKVPELDKFEGLQFLDGILGRTRGEGVAYDGSTLEVVNLRLLFVCFPEFSFSLLL
jgi:hypothetical protein